jgi:hypothetical protein
VAGRASNRVNSPVEEAEPAPLVRVRLNIFVDGPAEETWLCQDVRIPVKQALNLFKTLGRIGEPVLDEEKLY